MAKLYDERIVNMSAEDFFRLQNDPDYEALQAKIVNYAAFEETSCTETDTGIRRTIHAEPGVTLPKPLQGFVRKRLGSNGFYLLETRDVPNEGLVYHWRVEPPVFSDRILIEGDFIVEPIDNTTCKRIIDGEFTVKLTGIGAMLAKFAAKELTRGYDKVPLVADAWLAGERA